MSGYTKEPLHTTHGLFEGNCVRLGHHALPQQTLTLDNQPSQLADRTG